jgi:hypothetical protein
MNDWLRAEIDALAERAGVEAPGLIDDDAKVVLDIARIASHTSGDRTNAPLLCYLIGKLTERAGSATLEELKAVVAERARDTE